VDARVQYIGSRHDITFGLMLIRTLYAKRRPPG